MTDKQIENQYFAMTQGVAMINDIISPNDNTFVNMSAVEGRVAVEKNVEHLELMLTKDYWTTEDMTTVNQAIADGNTYLA
jgi:hypothetical protein